MPGPAPLRRVAPLIALLVVALAGVGCEARPPGRETALSDAALSADGRTVRLTIVGPAPPGPGVMCSATYELSYDITAGVMDVVALAYERFAGGCPLTDLNWCTYNVDVELDEPFSVTAVRSRARASALLLVQAPERLVELPALPPDWPLRWQGGEWNAGGSWVRVYSPVEQVGPGGHSQGKLVARQFFDGIGGTDPDCAAPPVEVNGQPAGVHACLGEVELSWKIGPDTIALFANEADFSLDELVELAESAIAPTN